MRTRMLAAGATLALIAAAAGAASPDAAHLRLRLERMLVTGSALYVAAHPDDENTALLAWLAQGRKVRAGYLSLTRGDGGQNLIGTEQGDVLGVIRTEELLAARAVDGAEQFFTRAIDFGYSKSPEETLRVWGHEAVLADLVWVIRSFRPDVIVTRFPASGGGGHGHHTASAILAVEAFSAAADPSRFPEQLRLVEPWQATRLVWNAWRRPGDPPVPGRLTVDVGAYEPLLGRSYAEVAAEARTMHKSQGFGSSPRRGSLPQEFEHVAGARAESDLFEGVDLSWGRVPGGDAVTALLARAAAEFDDRRPWRSAPRLVEALAALDRLPANALVAAKRAELLEVVRDCLGLWFDVTSPAATAVPGRAVELTVTALNRSPEPISLRRVEVPHTSTGAPAGGALEENRPFDAKVSTVLPASVPHSLSYWLREAHGPGTYTLPEGSPVGAARSPAALSARFTVDVAGREVSFDVPAVHRWTDPVEGERWRPLAVVPPVTAGASKPVVFFPDAAARVVRVTARAHAAATARLDLELPAQWRVEPASVDLAFAKPGEERAVTFTVTPPPGTTTEEMVVRLDGAPARRAVEVDHRHIPPQLLLPLATARLVRVDVARPVERVGYVMGSGDEIPEVLRQIGFRVELLSDEELSEGDLSSFGAIVVGVRAFNTRGRLAALASRLMSYVESGGTLVVQYATSRETVTDAIGPFPLALSRDRVTDEAAAIELLDPGHPLLRIPHRIAAADFEGWVQERGLYHAGTWDPRYTPLLSMADPGEKPTRGALLVARHGAGTYVYTGLSFFRQLPAGVPGAIRLFVNLLGGGRSGD
ncbi:MAG: PIG-L family deacetylase [Acidobacteriota bacterium]